MNEPKLHLNENDHDNRMTNKSLKELKVTVNTNKGAHFFLWFIIEISWLNVFYLNACE